MSEDMKSDAATEGGGSDEPATPTSGDVLLNMFVHFAHRGIQTPITVCSSGLVFSGRLISLKTYTEESAALVGKSGLEVVFEEILQHIQDPVPGEGPVPDYTYVHLKDCKIFTPGQEGMPSNGTLMRIALSEIVAWSLGSFTKS